MLWKSSLVNQSFKKFQGDNMTQCQAQEPLLKLWRSDLGVT